MIKSIWKQILTLGVFCIAAISLVILLGAVPVAAKKLPILVFGHKSPDTDTVIGAMAAAHLWNARGIKAVPTVQGEVNPETAFILEKFSLATPEMLKSVAKRQVGIVDFSDAPQGPDDLAEAEIIFIIDHHKLGGLKTNAPLEAWLMPVGSSNTVLYEIFSYYKVNIPKDLAGGMLCAILSDTVIFKSVTTTKTDKSAATALAKIAGVTDPTTLGIELFNIKSATSDASAKELVIRDYKDFTMSGKKVGVGQLELVDLQAVDKRKPELLKAMAEIKKEKGNHSIFLMLTDIMQEATMLLVVTDNATVVKKAFNKDVANSEVWLPGVMSRKKQIIPNLEKAFGN